MGKYGNKKTELFGIVFDSKREAERWWELVMMERAGEIVDLRRQVSFDLIPECRTRSGRIVRGTKYVADFVYRDKEGRTVVEDAKGYKTKEYQIKKKLMLWVQGIEIQEV